MAASILFQKQARRLFLKYSFSVISFLSTKIWAFPPKAFFPTPSVLRKSKFFATFKVRLTLHQEVVLGSLALGQVFNLSSVTNIKIVSD